MDERDAVGGERGQGLALLSVEMAKDDVCTVLVQLLYDGRSDPTSPTYYVLACNQAVMYRMLEEYDLPVKTTTLPFRLPNLASLGAKHTLCVIFNGANMRGL